MSFSKDAHLVLGCVVSSNAGPTLASYHLTTAKVVPYTAEFSCVARRRRKELKSLDRRGTTSLRSQQDGRVV
jgi:hypothetical protein